MPAANDLIALDVDEPIWERFFQVFPLVLIGTREADGSHDLAPKHMAIPVSWQNLFGFVCTPRHRTYRNAQRTGVFTVSYPRPDQVVATALAASPRCGDDDKPALAALPVFPASIVDGVLVEHGYLHLECELARIVDGLGENSLIIGRVVAAHAAPTALRALDRDDNEILRKEPLLAYLFPMRFAVVEQSQGFPVPAGFKR